MFCWHKWTNWSQPEMLRGKNMLGQEGVIWVQTKNCTKCGKFKRNIL